MSCASAMACKQSKHDKRLKRAPRRLGNFAEVGHVACAALPCVHREQHPGWRGSWRARCWALLGRRRGWPPSGQTSAALLWRKPPTGPEARRGVALWPRMSENDGRVAGLCLGVRGRVRARRGVPRTERGVLLVHQAFAPPVKLSWHWRSPRGRGLAPSTAAFTTMRTVRVGLVDLPQLAVLRGKEAQRFQLRHARSKCAAPSCWQTREPRPVGRP